MDDLQSIVQCHEQVLRSMGSQLALLIQAHQSAESRETAADRRMDQFDRSMKRAFRLGVLAYRRKRRMRQQEDRRLEKQFARSQAAREKRMDRLEQNLASLERNIDRHLKGWRGSNGQPGAGLAGAIGSSSQVS